MEATERFGRWPPAKARGDVARYPLRQQPWVSLGSSPLSRTTEQSLDHDRTNKAGYRDEDHLWSRCFEGPSRCLYRARFRPRQLQERRGRRRVAGGVLPTASGGTGGDGGDWRL